MESKTLCQKVRQLKKKEEFDLKTRTTGVSGSPHPHLHSDLLKMPNWTVHAPGPKIWNF